MDFEVRAFCARTVEEKIHKRYNVVEALRFDSEIQCRWLKVIVYVMFKELCAVDNPSVCVWFVI